MDQIMDRLANESVTVKLLAQQFVAINAETARRGGAIRSFGIVVARQRAADGIQLVWVGVGWHKYRRIRRRYVRIAPDVLIGQGIMRQECAVVTAEPIAPVIAHAALLREA